MSSSPADAPRSIEFLYDPHKRLDEVAALERCSWGSWLTEAQRHRRYSRLGADRRGISETDADRHGAAPNDAERLRGLTAAREARRCLFVAHPQPFVVKAPPPDVEKTARRLGASAKELREITKLVDLVIAGKEHLALVEAKTSRKPSSLAPRHKRRPALVKFHRKRRAASKVGR